MVFWSSLEMYTLDYGILVIARNVESLHWPDYVFHVHVPLD